MAIKTQAQILAESNTTYVDNAVGSITPANVRTLNTNWVDSTIYVEQTGSMTVATASLALTASFVIGSIATSSFALNAGLLNGTGSNGFASTGSLNAVSSSGQQVSASYIALSGSYNVFSGSASTRLTNTSQSLQAVSASDQQTSASYIALSGSYNVFSGSASTRITANSSSIQSVSASTQQVSASYIALSASYNVFSGSASARITAVSSSDQQLSASYIALSASYNTFSGSASTRITNNATNIQTLTSATASYAVLANNQTFSGKNTFNNDITASNVRITGTASIAFLDVTFQSSSVIYSSGSNQFGDASNDTQTLFGTVNVATGPLVVTGSANFKNVITGSISGNAATATSSTSASYAYTASSAINSLSASYAYTASSAISAYTASSAINATSASFATTSATASFTTTALTASSVQIDSYNNVNSQFFLTMVNGTGDKRMGIDTDSLVYNPNTNLLSGQIESALSASSLYTENYNNINSTYYLTMVDNATGWKRYGLDTDLSYNPSTNVLSATAQSAASASSIQLDNYNGSNTTYYLTMATDATGFKRVGIDTDLAYNPSTNLLSGLITSASFATSASRAISALSSSYAENSGTASVLLGSVVSASYALSASYANRSLTSSYFDGAILYTNDIKNDTQPLNIAVSGLNYLALSTENGLDIRLLNPSGSFPQSFILNTNGTTLTTNQLTISGSTQITGSLNAQSISSSFSGSGAEIFGVVSSSYALTASFALNAGGGSAFPFSGSAVITGSLQLTGSFSIASGSILLLANTALNNRGLSAMVTQSAASRNNIIAATFGGTTATGSFVISGSNNYISLASPVANSNFNNGAAFGANLTNSILTVLPLVTGSNGAANARPLPTISNSSVNARITINDRRAIQSTQALLTIANSAILTTFSFSSNTGSYGIQDGIMSAASTVIDYTGSVVAGIPAGGSYGNAIFGTSHNIKQVVSQSADFTYSLISGQSNRLLLSGSGADNNLNAVGVIGNFLIITGSSSSDGSDSGTLLVGRYNNPIGNLGDSLQTVVAVGTGASEATRRTSLHVSSSGLTTISDGLRVSGSQVITGSLYGSPVSQSVSSLTASLNLAAGNFFNLTLPASANTYITASGQVPGQTVNIKVTQGATTGSLSFGAGFKQVSGSFYTGSSTANAVDIVTLISFDSTGLYVSNVNNLI